MSAIRDRRRECGMTQEYLGSEIGKTKQYISDLEKGKRDIFGVASGTIFKIAQVLDMRMENIMYDAEKTRSSKK